MRGKFYGENPHGLQTPCKQRPFERRRAVNTRPQEPDGAKPYLNSDRLRGLRGNGRPLFMSEVTGEKSTSMTTRHRVEINVMKSYKKGGVMEKRYAAGIFMAMAAFFMVFILSAHAETKGFPKDLGKDQSQVANPPPSGPGPGTQKSITPGTTTVPTQLKSPFVDKPMVSPRMEKKLPNQLQKGIKKLPGGKTLSVGPSIRSFSAITNQCVNPDPNRSILSYRVLASRGAAKIQRVKINALHGDGDRIRVIHDRSAPSGNPWPEVSESGIRDPEPAADVYAYVLVVRDTEGRSFSRRLTYRYRRPLRFEFLSRNALWDPRTSDLVAQARLENGRNARWEYTDAGGTHRNTGVRSGRVDGEANTYNLSWGPYAAGLNRSQLFAITFEPISRACGENPITRTITWESAFGRGPVPAPGGAGSSSSGCDDPRVGTACSVHPGECIGRAADWTTSGKYQCVSGEVRCVAERNRDFCTVCGAIGGTCGGCPGNSCSESSLCNPSDICRADHTPGGTVYRCFSIRDTSVPVRIACTPIRGFCWTPEEVGAVYNCQEAIDNPERFREMAPPWGYAEPGGGS